jgi:hypothetical protein
MGRAWRIESERALYHILSRGNEQKDIFYDKDKGHYFILGVQAHLYKKISKDGKPIVESSTISWSCSETCTNKNPQYDQHNWL